MKLVVQNYRSGELKLVDVPQPECRPGGVLVRTRNSLISAGTELMKLRESKLSLVGKARARPDQVKKVLETAGQLGVAATYRKVMNRLDSLTPLGYSLSGEVVAVGDGVDDLRLGQRVACAGNEYALHAEMNFVPRNLCVPIPDAVDDVAAAFTTVGSIALHGFRQAEAQLGEVACVIGLGLVGQILVRILAAAGVHAVGIDPVPERCRLAEDGGAVRAVAGDPEGVSVLRKTVADITGGYGVDHVFLAASTESNDPVEIAAELARDRARVVDIGKSKLDLPWKEYYELELDVRFSRSHGPGRYDPTYEEAGVDYPIGYVRWTERRNMSAFLDLLATERVSLAQLVSAVVPFEEAVSAYERLSSGELGGVGVLFQYPEAASGATGGTWGSVGITQRPPERREEPRPVPVVRIGAIGCGNYASTMLYPHLVGRDDVELAAVATASSLSAANARRKFGFSNATTNYRELLADDSVDAVIIATRHASHARLVMEAVRAGKAVFVEKPLALTLDELGAVVEAIYETGNDRLMVGFNRRFAPMLGAIKDAWGETRAGGAVFTYVVNAGPADPSSWYARTEEHGSRFIGEGGHFIDTASWWFGEDPVSVQARRAGTDGLVATLVYPSGVADITYATNGHPRAPKERVAVHGSGRAAEITNFVRGRLWRPGLRPGRRFFSFRGPDKGQKGELEAFVTAIRDASMLPISLDSLVATTASTLGCEQSIRDGDSVSVPALVKFGDE